MFLSSALLGEQRQRDVSLVGKNQIAHEKRDFSISLRTSDRGRTGVATQACILLLAPALGLT